MTINSGYGRMCFSKSTIVNIFITLFVLVVVLFISTYLDNYSVNNLEFISIVAVVVYVWIVISFFFKKREVNFYLIFIIMSFFFFFGQHLILLCNIDFNDISRSILGNRLPINFLNKTGIFIIEAMLLLHLGYLLSFRNVLNKNRVETFCVDDKYQEGLKKIGLIMFLISIVPTIIILINNMMTTVSFGYGELFQTEYYTRGGFDNIIKFLSLYTVPSLYMLLISYKGSNKVKYIVLAFCLYIVLYLMSGSRLSAVLILSTLILIKHLWFNPITKKKSISYGFLGFFLLILLSLISSIRNSLYLASDPFNLIVEAFNNIWTANPFFVAIEEAGFTFLATACVVTYCPSDEPYNYGISYLNGLFALFPNLFWDIHPASTNTDIIFKGYLTSYGGIGSSFIAEAYYNFGEFSLLIMPIFGWLLGYLCHQTKIAVKFHSSMLFYICMYTSSFVLFYVRSDTISFFRNFVYFAIVPCFFAKILTSKNKKIPLNKRDIRKSTI